MNLYIYILVMAVVTYLIRAIPLILVNKKIENHFIRSFLYYVPYTALATMTFPAILFSTSELASAIAGFVVAMILGLRRQSLIVVAAAACITVFIVERAMVLL